MRVSKQKQTKKGVGLPKSAMHRKLAELTKENARLTSACERSQRLWGVHANIAQALARGITDLYYVNLDTDGFIEYHTDDQSGVLTEARRGRDFFEGCERDAQEYIHPEDQAAFVRAMNREFLRQTLERSNVFEMTYRKIKEGKPFYVQMRVSRVEDNPHFIVIAVSDVDELMRKRCAEERMIEERAIYARLHALTGNFICVYVVDPETERYREFSATNDYVKSFSQAKEGTDFFRTLGEAARVFSHPDDRDRVLPLITRENVMAKIARSGIFTLGYRIMMDGKPLHVHLKAAMVNEKEGPRLIVGLNDVEAEYRQKQIDREIARQKEIFDQITASLAEQYDTLYYIDIATSTYLEISSTDEYKKLNVPATGNDFFAESRRSIRKYVHPEDQKKAMRLHYKDIMLGNLKNRRSFSLSWRLVVNGQVRNIRHTEIMARDGRHIIVCIKNIDAEVQARMALEESQRKSVTFTQIAERLASYFDLIYYIDCKNSHYAEFSAKRKSGELKIQEEGDDFFGNASRNIDRLIYSKDRNRIRLFLDRDYLISQLEHRRQLTEDYRMVLANGKTQYTRMSVTYASDRSHFIICVENREEDVRREQEHLAALSMANEMARRDELTGTKNKTAYHEMEEELQRLIDEGGTPFGIVVCDINGLKTINDTEGHKAGDGYIKASCRLICRIFYHSPVFRIGGDEFVVILRGQDYANRKKLLARLKKQVEESIRIGEGPVVSSGLAEYQPGTDYSVEDVFNHADSRMYGEKARLKEQKMLQESHTLREKANLRVISEDRRIMLDALYKSFEVVSDGTYVFLCDMKYDFSRWSKNAVDTFGLPSEYMYGAGDIIKRNAEISVLLFSISRFSEINEIYGYQFGNRVLQLYARSVFETTGNTGHTYRIDGTTFAVISSTLSIPELRESYNRFRAFLHESFLVDGKKILLDLHCGALRVNHFDVDSQTVYACLNFANQQSKLRQQGELVEFQNELNEENHQRLETLHAIRASILHGYEAFTCSISRWWMRRRSGWSERRRCCAGRVTATAWSHRTSLSRCWKRMRYSRSWESGLFGKPFWPQSRC